MEEKRIGPAMVKSILKRRSGEVHKGDFGRALIIAGSGNMTGAAVLAVKGAFRSGAGMVYAGLPKEGFYPMQAQIPEAICLEREGIFENLGLYDSICIGPGLGTDFEAGRLTEGVIRHVDCPLVIDADGLNIVVRDNLYALLKERKRKGLATIITPHWGEALRLVEGRPSEMGLRERIYMAEELEAKTGAIVVLKGSETIVADESRMYFNTTGNAGMATAGSGDVLAGIITSFCGQREDGGHGIDRLPAFEAACAGVFIHGRAGDMAAKKLGEYGMMSGDLADFIPLAIKGVVE